MDSSGLVDQLFRHEAGRITAALCARFGLDAIDVIEDVVQDAFSSALERWRFHGVPENPGAWLMRTAQNRAIDRLRRSETRRRLAPAVTLEHSSLMADAPAGPDAELVYDEHELRDEQLRMMFSCCHPQLSVPARLSIILKMLCGFGAGEVAHALLARPAAVEKRLTRARTALRESRTLFEWDENTRLLPRLDAVQHALYLLFNEGYHSANPSQTVRRDLCYEALRLGRLLGEHSVTGRPSSRALVALMCFHAARIDARTDAAGAYLPLAAQDRGRWDTDLISMGHQWLASAAEGDVLSRYHLEAAIAAEHCRASALDTTNWAQIVAYYDRLLDGRDDPVAALSRAIAKGYADGPNVGLGALDALAAHKALANYPFLPAARAECLERLGRLDAAADAYREAGRLARTDAERRYFETAVTRLL